MKFWRTWKYKNITFVILGIVLALGLSRWETFHGFLLHLGGFGYLSAVIAGSLFVSTFTIAAGAVILFFLAETLPAWQIGILAGIGAVLTDLTIFRFVKSGLAQEVERLYNEFGGRHWRHLFHSKYFSWMLPVAGALIIASPLPDELGVSLLGLSKMSAWQFVAISFILNFIGIFLIISAGTLVR